MKGKIERLLDSSQRIFEGEVKVSFYLDRMVAEGYCWHCKSRTSMTTMMTAGEAKQAQADRQYQRNLVEMAKDDLQNDHQCGALLHDGKDIIEDVFSQVGKR